MEVLGEIRNVEQRQIPGKDGRPDWTKTVLIVELSEPLALIEVQVTREFEGRIDQLRQLRGKRAIIPMYTPRVFGSRTEAAMSAFPKVLNESAGRAGAA